MFHELRLEVWAQRHTATGEKFGDFEHTTDMFQDAWEHESFTGSKEKILKLVALFAPEKFGEFFAEFKAKKMEKDASWVGAVSPV